MGRHFDFREQSDIGEKAESIVREHLRARGASYEDVRNDPYWRTAGVDFRVSTPLGTMNLDVKADTREYNDRVMLETVSVAVPPRSPDGEGESPPITVREGNVFTSMAHKFVYVYRCGTLLSVDVPLVRRWLIDQGLRPAFLPDGRLPPMRPSTNTYFMSRVLNARASGIGPRYIAEVCVLLRPLEPKPGETTPFAEILNDESVLIPVD